MKNKVLFFDPVSPKGHVGLNSMIYDSFKGDKKIVVGTSLKGEFDHIDNIAYFKNKILKKNRFYHFCFCALFSIYYLFFAKLNNYDSVVFLSYDKYTIFFISFFSYVLGIKVYAFEHNTFPVGQKFLSYFLNINSKNIIRLCFMSNMVDFFRNKNISSYYVHHPIVGLNLRVYDEFFHKSKSKGTGEDFFYIKRIDKYNFYSVIFCPSGSNNIDILKSKILEYPDFLFIIKRPKTKISELENISNVYLVDYFYDLGEWFKVVDFVYLPIDFEYRVSGFFYESLKFSKKCIISNCGFSDYIKLNFPNYYLSSEDNWYNFKNASFNFDIVNYNLDFSKLINKILIKDIRK